MVSGRRSSRLKGGALGEGLADKRPRKPNANSMKAYEEKLASRYPPNDLIRKVKRKKVSKKPLPPAEPATPPPVIVLSSMAAADPSLGILASSPPTNNLIICITPSKKKEAALKASFDPSQRNFDHSQWVKVSMEVHMNGRVLGHVICSIDINDPFCMDFDTLAQACVVDYINKWAELRNLTGDDFPVRTAWRVRLGPLKGNSTTIVAVDNNISWRHVLTDLRHRFYQKDTKGAAECNAKAYWTTLDRAHTPPLNSKLPTKSSIPRRTTLGSDPLSTDPSEGEDSQGNEYKEAAPPGPSKKKANPKNPKVRDLVTNRMLKVTPATAKADKKKEQQRNWLAKLHECKKVNYSNYKGCCFKTKRGAHHEIDIEEQGEWADDIINEVTGVTFDKPPIAWREAYVTGWKECTVENKKTSGPRKETTPAVLAAEPPTQQASQLPPVYHIHNPPPQQHYQPQYPPSYGPASWAPPYGPRPPGPPSRHAPSSPLKSQQSRSNLLGEYAEFLCSLTNDEGLQESYVNAIELAIEQDLTLELLKDVKRTDCPDLTLGVYL
jgi:hypothetical protein